MTKILRIQSGGDLENSATRAIGQLLIDGMLEKEPSATVLTRDLVREPLPHISADFVRNMFTNDEAPSLALSNRLVDELLGADVLVVEAPMYNFSIPSALKAWLDHVVRARKTFRITGHGVEGMLGDKKGWLVLGSGAVYSAGPFAAMDFQEPYLRAMLGFLGMKNLETIRIEGLNMGPDAAEKGLAAARARASAA